MRPAPAVAARALAREAELVAQVRSQGARRRALARVAGRIVATRAWERLGFARAADYARERVGLSARQLLELAHTDAALARLPRVEAALVAGRVGWTRARLLGRVATAENEARWLAFAERVTARALEREVRRVDRDALEAAGIEASAEIVEPERYGDGTEIREGVVIRCTPVVRAKWSRVRQLAQRVAGERLAPSQALEAAVAEVLSTIALDELPESPLAESNADSASVAADVCAGDAAPSDRAPGAANACAGSTALPGHAANGGAAACERDFASEGSSPALTAEARGQGLAPSRPSPAPLALLPPALRALVDGLESADEFALDARLRRAVALEQQGAAEIAPRLRRLVDEKAYLRLGHANADAWVVERLGISPRKARALARLERACAAAPELRSSFREGRLSWVQAQLLIPLLLARDARPHRREWVERARRVSVRRLEEDVEQALLLRETDPERFAASAGLAEAARGDGAEGGAGAADEGAGRQTCARPTPPERGACEPETARFFLSAPRDVARLFRATLCTVRRMLERHLGRPATPGDGCEAIFDHALETWGALQPTVGAAHRVFARDGWRCTVPGCTSFRSLHDHHVEYRSAGGGDELANRTTLCAWHHLRGVHAGRVRCVGRAPGELRFELGILSNGAALLRYAPGEVIAMEP